MAVTYAQRVWVWMDKKRKMILKGTRKNYWLVPVDSAPDKKRILTYQSQDHADNAQYEVRIEYSNKVAEYLYKEYDAEHVFIDGAWYHGSRTVWSCLEPVEMIMMYTEVEHET